MRRCTLLQVIGWLLLLMTMIVWFPDEPQPQELTAQQRSEVVARWGAP